MVAVMLGLDLLDAAYVWSAMAGGSAALVSF